MMRAWAPMIPWFVATAKFDKTDATWAKYVAWSGLIQLDEVVSLDSSLCPTVLPDIKPEYWSHIVNEDFMLHFFTDLDYLRGETAAISRKNLLCVFRNPPVHPTATQAPEGFEFIGYDLLEKDCGISAPNQLWWISESILQQRAFRERPFKGARTFPGGAGGPNSGIPQRTSCGLPSLGYFPLSVNARWVAKSWSYQKTESLRK
jgi:hypothetical protein